MDAPIYSYNLHDGNGAGGAMSAGTVTCLGAGMGSGKLGHVFDSNLPAGYGAGREFDTLNDPEYDEPIDLEFGGMGADRGSLSEWCLQGVYYAS